MTCYLSYVHTAKIERLNCGTILRKRFLNHIIIKYMKTKVRLVLIHDGIQYMVISVLMQCQINLFLFRYVL